MIWMRELPDPVKLFKLTEITPMIIAPRRASQKPSTRKLVMMLPTNNRRSALITRVNKPKVRMSRGKARNMRIGLTKAFRIPKRRDASTKSKGFS